MTGEIPSSGGEDELRRLWHASPGLDDVVDEATDYLLAHDAMIGPDPDPELVARVQGVADRLADMDPDEVDALVEKGRRTSPLTAYLSEVIPGMPESGDTSPVPAHRSTHFGNPAGLSQEEWDDLPESAKRLLRRDNPTD